MPSLRERLTEIGREFPAQFAEHRDGTLRLEFVVAEKKAFLFKKKIEFRCRVRVDDQAKTAKYFEMLVEKGSGLGAGGDGLTPGFSFKKETYSLKGKAREETIEEQAKLFGGEFKYTFDYGQVRREVEKAAAELGYSFAVSLLFP